ncbi:DUF4362 domain-containing protein [Paenibacillus sp. N4]|uniref:DUF4362 domain-containing protein n=1 Tax=Paenibacillus vietnamensis TaxID=2590547 RepID=UPI001CD1550A|nr:DUF4362 domain-containing protein [Paenibacillus vietnamensis]MCA0758199.1 DUF4362 domain-containing protein [Paenibacillus vietnamensis]
MGFKKWLLIGALLLLASGCGARTDGEDPGEPGTGTKKYDHAVDESTDVIDMHGRITNLEKLDAFFAGETDNQRLVRYTIEGDPIFYELTRKQDSVEVRYDTSQDKFGSPSVKTYGCESLGKKETERGVSYVLTGCDADREIEVLTVAVEG